MYFYLFRFHDKPNDHTFGIISVLFLFTVKTGLTIRMELKEFEKF